MTRITQRRIREKVSEMRSNLSQFDKRLTAYRANEGYHVTLRDWCKVGPLTAQEAWRYLDGLEDGAMFTEWSLEIYAKQTA